jgi:hypothetical protein
VQRKKKRKKKRLCYNNAEDISMREVSTIKMLLNQELERLRTEKKLHYLFSTASECDSFREMHLSVVQQRVRIAN